MSFPNVTFCIFAENDSMWYENTPGYKQDMPDAGGFSGEVGRAFVESLCLHCRNHS